MSGEDARTRIAELARQIAEQGRQLQRRGDADAPEPPRHWSEVEREAEEPAAAAPAAELGPAPLQLEAAELAARETACARLRALLSDGRWHAASELLEVGGTRYGGRLHEIRRGEDGAPALDVEGEVRSVSGRNRWFYRAVLGGRRG